MTIAVIDLGTNGFRLQIAETFERMHYRIIHKESNELKLASEGIHHIGDAPFQRGVETMRHFSTVLKQHNVLKIKAFATAAVRMADNGQDFIETVKHETGIEIELISGAREAELIYKGMSMNPHLEALSITTMSAARTITPCVTGNGSIEPILMVDVGGGSVELIIGNSERMLWAHSFNIGVAILKQQFHKNDVIRPKEIAAIKRFLNRETKDFLHQLSVFKPQKLLVACGTLDFFVKILRGHTDSKFQISDFKIEKLGLVEQHTLPENRYKITKKQFTDFYKTLTFLPEHTLYDLPNIPKDKIEMLAVSLVLIDWIMKKMGADHITASANSMKAGILYEMTLEC